MNVTHVVNRRTGLVKDRSQTLAEFRDKMQAAGITPQVLRVSRESVGLHENAEGISKDMAVYRLSWRKQPARLPGGLDIPGTQRDSEKFVKLPVHSVNLTGEAKRRYNLALDMAGAGEVALFLSTRHLSGSHMMAILAVCVSGRWLELYRWDTSWQELGLSRLAVCES